MNQRALIDSKVYLPYLICLPLHLRFRLEILARYSGEHTSKRGSSLFVLFIYLLEMAAVFRELLQNSDDAGAQHVQVKFYTEDGLEALKSGQEPSKLPDTKTALVRRSLIQSCTRKLTRFRYTAMLSRMMGFHFERKIGKGSRRSQKAILMKRKLGRQLFTP